MSSRRGRYSGRLIYLNANDEESLPNYTKYGVDFLFKYKGFSALGEYIKSTAEVPSDITKESEIMDQSVRFLVNEVQDVDSYVREE